MEQDGFCTDSHRKNAFGRQVLWQETFKLLEEPLDQNRFLMELGMEKSVLPHIRGEENRIAGCKTNIWRELSVREGRIIFQADSDSILVRGALSVLEDIFHTARPEETDNLSLSPLDTLDPMVLNPDIVKGGLWILLKELKNMEEE